MFSLVGGEDMEEGRGGREGRRGREEGEEGERERERTGVAERRREDEKN